MKIDGHYFYLQLEIQLAKHTIARVLLESNYFLTIDMIYGSIIFKCTVGVELFF